MKQTTEAAVSPRLGWLRATVTAAALVAVLGCAVAVLGAQVFAGSTTPADDVVLGTQPLVEPPPSTHTAARPATPTQPAQGETLLDNWRYTRGSFH